MSRFFKVLTVVMALVVLWSIGAMMTFASEDTVDQSEGIDITTATPEEIEDIGMAAMLEAGLAQEGDVEIIDVTPQEDVQGTDSKTESSAVSAIDIVNLVLLIVAVLAIALLYFFCWKKGIIDFSVFKSGK